MIFAPGRAVLELAHALVDQADQVVEPVGHRGIESVARALEILLADARPVGRAAAVRHVALGDRDQLREDLDFFLHARAAAEEHVDYLFEVEQPERELEVLRRKNLRAVAEAAPVFVV